MRFSDVIQNIGGIGAAIGLLAAAAVFLKGSVYKGAIAALESTVNAQEIRINDLETKVKEDTVSLTALSTQNKILLAQRPSAEIITDALSLLKKHDDRVYKMHHQMMTAIKEARL